MKKIIGVLTVLMLIIPAFPSEDSNIDTLLTRLYNAPEAESAVKLLLTINRAYLKQRKDGEGLSILDGIRENYSGKEIDAVAVCLSVPRWLQADSVNLVETECLRVKKDFPKTQWAAEALYNLGELYLNHYENQEEAEKYFQELIDEFPDSRMVKSAAMYLEN